MNRSIVFLLLVWATTGAAQQAVIKGRVSDAETNEGIPFANVVVQGTTIGVATDLDGNYLLSGLEPALYNLVVSSVGYKSAVVYEIRAYGNREQTADVALSPQVNMLEGVSILASPFSRTAESPVSLRNLGTEEIQRNPGGARDISRVIRSLPGVSSTASFRNDILIRGGAPNENRFFLDGMEVPNINHFATQGSSGGPVGLINVDFLREVDLFTGAFPASRGNALSSVFDFKLREGRTDRWGTTFTIGSSDIGLTMEGPVGEKGNILFSARRSYLQFLFQALQLPFLPTYNDFQYRYKIRFNNKHELTFLGLGAIDQFSLNLEANETEDQRLLLDLLPVNEQWNYATGAVYKHYHGKGVLTAVASRNMLNNTAIKYVGNDESSPENLLLDYSSREMENKFRLENTSRMAGYKLETGIAYEYVRYTNSTFNQVFDAAGPLELRVNSALDFHKYGFFAQVSRSYASDRVTLSAGVRGDGASYSEEMSNPLEQLSPRVSASWAFLPNWSLNANAGRYFQLPAYTVLGFRDEAGTLVNRENGVEYIRADHLVAGLEYTTSFNTRITAEGFYKHYDRYPFLIRDSVALANLGADFGVIGNEPVAPLGEGRAYGAEFMMQQKIYKGFFGILAYTYVISEFKDEKGQYVPSSWDNRSILSLTAGYKMQRNWEVGARFRYAGGLPYTPFDLMTSSLIASWQVNNSGLPDWDRLNSLRLGSSHGLDVRVDKKWAFPNWNLNLYLDIENIYGFESPQPPLLFPETDAAGEFVVDPLDPTRYRMRTINNNNGTILPTLGVIIII
jgi:hypothetical protein